MPSDRSPSQSPKLDEAKVRVRTRFPNLAVGKGVNLSTGEFGLSVHTDSKLPAGVEEEIRQLAGDVPVKIVETGGVYAAGDTNP